MTDKSQPASQRIIDLIAALIRSARAGGITFRDIIPQVPGYALGDRDEKSVAMQFERDKKALRDRGFRIEVVGLEQGEARYKLPPTEVFMPYLARDDDEVERTDGFGIRSLGVQRFTTDELTLLVQGARRLLQLGHQSLADGARTGLMRLGHDLALDELEVAPEIVRPEPQIDSERIELLDDAAGRRKWCTFQYDGLRGDGPRARTVHPYLVTFRDGRWYLVAHCVEAQAIREFRLRRITDLVVNNEEPKTPDFEIPDDFDPQHHTQVRPIWQMGNEAPEEITVRIVTDNGITAPARRLGVAHATDPMCTRFTVCQREPFFHWVLGLGAVARVTAPTDAGIAFDALVQALAARYATEASV